MKERKTTPSRQTRRTVINEDKLEILVTIVNRRKAEYYVDLIQNYEVNMQFSVAGEGTLKSVSRDKLELVAAPKMVIFSVIRQSMRDKIMQALDEKFNTIRDGEGIAYTIPMASVIGKLVFGFLSNQENVLGR